MGNASNVPKLTVEITRAQADRIAKLFPHGTLKPTIGVMLDELLDLMETHGSGNIIGAVFSKTVKPVASLPTFRKAVSVAKVEPPKEKF